jgi:phospholipase C
MRLIIRRHVDASLTNKTNHLLPFYMNAQGGDSFQATQCATAGTNSLQANQAALNNDLNNIWPSKYQVMCCITI